MRTKLICQCNLILETEGKINLRVTFIQWLITQSKLSLVFIETLLVPHKTAYFLNDWHNSYKNADGNSKFYIAKLISFSKLALKSNQWKQTLKFKVSVNLANKYKVKDENFIILIFCFPVFFLWSLASCNTSTISFPIPVSFFFEDFFKASKEQITIIGI